MTEPNPDTAQDNQTEQQETVAQRSARLEAEAAALYAMPKHAVAAEEGRTPQPNLQQEADMTALKGELEKAKDTALRALAEAENARKRAAKEREDASKYAIASFSKGLLTVSDNLRRALEAVGAETLEGNPSLKALVEGIEATERDLQKAFEQNGIRRLSPMDEPFNPNFHEVMFEMPAPGKKPGTVIQVIEVGYTLHDRLLRPARVGVAKDEGPALPGSHINTQA